MEVTSALVILTFGILISIVMSQPPMRPPPLDSVCGIPPRVMPQDCCTGIDKIAREEMFRKCGNECQQQGPCCHKNCIPREMGILSGSKVDKATALNSMKAAVGADNDWINAVTKAVEECFNPNSPFMSAATREMQSNCDTDTTLNGNTGICIKRYFMKNCPKPVNSEDCKAFRTFFDCLDKNIVSGTG